MLLRKNKIFLDKFNGYMHFIPHNLQFDKDSCTKYQIVQRDRLKAMQKYPHLIAEAVQFTDPEREHEKQ